MTTLSDQFTCPREPRFALQPGELPGGLLVSGLSVLDPGPVTMHHLEPAAPSRALVALAPRPRTRAGVAPAQVADVRLLAHPDWPALAACGDARLAELALALRPGGLPAGPDTPACAPVAAAVGVVGTTSLAAAAAALPGLACALGAATLVLLAWLLELDLRRRQAQQARQEAERALVARHAAARDAARVCRALGVPPTPHALEQVRRVLSEVAVGPLALPAAVRDGASEGVVAS